jgi:diguanylate cyclase (GGDEF)-like protein
MKKLFRLGPVSRISIGIVSLMLSLVLAFDSLVDIFPSESKYETEMRKQLSAVISNQVAGLLASGNIHDMQAILERIAGSTPGIRSIGVRAKDRELMAASRTHAWQWAAPQATSTAQHVVVPLFAGGTRWGDVELAFADVAIGGPWAWMHHPSVMLGMLFVSAGLIITYLYLRRTLQYLDPSSTVPQHVRKAFDTLAEAVLVLDTRETIVLANAAFSRINSDTTEAIEGKSVMQLNWLIAGLSDGGKQTVYPWASIRRPIHAIRGKSISVALPDGRKRELIMNCSVIDDGTDVPRGFLLTLNDVTELSEANSSLKRALLDLESSKEKIEEQNKELKKNAFHDYLTGCLNRRAFFSKAGLLYQSAVEQNGALCCIMVDIDHFKRFNDTYGHALGDLVIQQVATALGRSVRNEDLLCRYGGEEFCILLAGLSKSEAAEIADRMRLRIAKESGPGVRTVAGLQITSSFGLSSIHDQPAPSSLQQLIELADCGLYVAKKAGRNRVGDADGNILSGFAESSPERI